VADQRGTEEVVGKTFSQSNDSPDNLLRPFGRLMSMRRRLKFLAILVLVAVILWLAASALVAWQLTRRSRESFAEPPPAIAGAVAESPRLTTSDNEQIGAWFVRGDAGKPCVLLLHGNGQSRAEMLPQMRWLAEARFSVLAISLRAHGDSSGTVNDIGWSARHDVVAAVGFLRRECPDRPIVVVGRSLGAAAAIFAAGELQGDVAGYFLEQPYKDLKSAVRNRLQNHLPPVLDWVAYGGLLIWAPVFLPVDPNRISPYDGVRAIPEGVPVVIITGSADRHAHLDEVRALAERVKSGARLVVFEGAVHEPLDRRNPELYRSSLMELLSGVGRASR
jgi:uncharacterized protein